MPEMQPFASLTGVAAPLPEADIDTDIIFPGALPAAAGQGRPRPAPVPRGRSQDGAKHATSSSTGRPSTARRSWSPAPISARGSSREQAVWALADFGIRCVIAPSFGEIFHANCFKNGVLAVALASSEYDSDAWPPPLPAQPMTVDLETQTHQRCRAARDRPSTSIPTGVSLASGLDEIGADPCRRCRRHCRGSKPAARRALALSVDGRIACSADSTTPGAPA